MVMVRLASRAVIGTADKASDVAKALSDLAKADVRPIDVSLVAKPDVLESTAVQSRTKGALGGLGMAARWLVEHHEIEKPGVGKIVGAGPLASALAKSPTTSPVGALVMQGIPQHDAATFATALAAGKILVLCGVADRTMGERIRAILDRDGLTSIAYYSGRPYGTAFHGTGPGLR